MRSRKFRWLIAFTIVGMLGAGVSYKKLDFDELFPRTVGAKAVPTPLEVAHDSDEPCLCFVAIGDTGKPTRRRQSVIRQLRSSLDQVPLDFIVLLGDNFYESGVESTEDPLWHSQFELPFLVEEFPMPFYACLGNHDHNGNTQAQIDYGVSHRRWKMPGSYYSFEKSVEGQENLTVQFFVLDTNTIKDGDESASDQILWFSQELQKSTATWKIVAGHHPVVSGGDHGGSEAVYHALVPIFDKFNVDLYISGHDHDLQLHDVNKSWLQLVSGAGSKLRTVHWIDSTLYAEATPGFSRITLSENKLTIEIIATNGLRYVHEFAKQAPVLTSVVDRKN